MPVRLLREEEVRSLVTMADALNAVELAFMEQGRGTAINEPRRRVHQPAGTLQLMGGALTQRGYWGFKAYTATRHGARFTVNLYDVHDGALLALIEADLLGQLRTGAASGVATKHLARVDAGILALFGSGYQAETQLEAIAAVHTLGQVRVYSRSAERRAAFVERMSRRLNLDIRTANTPREAVDGADMITTITTSTDPVFDGNDLAPGAHVNAAGANSSIRAELDATAIRRASHIFTDDVEQARIESGNLIRAYERNVLNWSQVRPLADVIAGTSAGRTGSDEITLFESHGIALWDIALAAHVYERAQAHDVGTLWR
ncbi:MAG: ornithine cyclodeaminase family protein [Chloroflexi bacterium]|nr:ornithine cyclodeaminase family protein [Chloroflexota bacterium]